MLGTGGATVLSAVIILFAGLLGIGAGGIASALLRRSWGLKIAAIDAVLAIVVAGIAAYLFTVVEGSFGVYRSVVLPMWAVAVVTVFIRHLLRQQRQ
jgi:hypothetical protein